MAPRSAIHLAAEQGQDKATISCPLRLTTARGERLSSNVMEVNEYDLVVIGSGPAGQKGAICAAKMRKKVAIIDRKKTIGGVCVHTGTIPSKTFTASGVVSHWLSSTFFLRPKLCAQGSYFDVGPDFPRAIRHGA